MRPLSTLSAAADYDVLIVGGSVAGLSAALVLGRSLRRVLVVDAGKPCNRQTPHSHNFFTRDGETPAQLLAIALEQLRHYPTVSFLTDTVVTANRQATFFQAETASGQTVTARKLILATGQLDIMPPIDGFAKCWGRSVLHCPYCHGYEVHDQRLGILANGETAWEMTRLIQHWSPTLTLFTNGPANLTTEQRQFIGGMTIPIVETEIVAIEHRDGYLHHLRMADGSRYELDAVFSRVPFRHHTDIASQLGCTLTEAGLIQTSATGETNVPGVSVAGDAGSLYRQVIIAAGSGSTAGAFLNRNLIEEDLAV